MALDLGQACPQILGRQNHQNVIRRDPIPGAHADFLQMAIDGALDEMTGCGPHDALRLHRHIPFEGPTEDQRAAQRHSASCQHQPQEPVHKAKSQRREQLSRIIVRGKRADCGSGLHGPTDARHMPVRLSNDCQAGNLLRRMGLELRQKPDPSPGRQAGRVLWHTVPPVPGHRRWRQEPLAILRRDTSFLL